MRSVHFSPLGFVDAAATTVTNTTTTTTTNINTNTCIAAFIINVFVEVQSVAKDADAFILSQYLRVIILARPPVP
jgi:hypothetical protein